MSDEAPAASPGSHLERSTRRACLPATDPHPPQILHLPHLSKWLPQSLSALQPLQKHHGARSPHASPQRPSRASRDA